MNWLGSMIIVDSSGVRAAGTGELKHDAVDQFRMHCWIVFLLYMLLFALAVILGSQVGCGTMGLPGIRPAHHHSLCGLFAVNLLYVLIIRVFKQVRRLRALLER